MMPSSMLKGPTAPRSNRVARARVRRHPCKRISSTLCPDRSTKCRQHSTTGSLTSNLRGRTQGTQVVMPAQSPTHRGGVRPSRKQLNTARYARASASTFRVAFLTARRNCRLCQSDLELPRLLQIEDLAVSSVTKLGGLAHLQA